MNKLFGLPATELPAIEIEGFTNEEVETGDFPPILSLLSPELAIEFEEMRIRQREQKERRVIRSD